MHLPLYDRIIERLWKKIKFLYYCTDLLCTGCPKSLEYKSAAWNINLQLGLTFYFSLCIITARFGETDNLRVLYPGMTVSPFCFYEVMSMSEIFACLEANPVIAAIGDDKWNEALHSPALVVFYMSANLLTLQDKVHQAHMANKYMMVHLDLAEGIGKDRTGLRYIAKCGADGIISTKSQLIRWGKELGLFTVQRFFAIDSGGTESIGEMFRATCPDLMEIMPGVATKVIRKYADSGMPVIAGGLIETKAEVLEALSSGATAVSTGKADLWYI